MNATLQPANTGMRLNAQVNAKGRCKYCGDTIFAMDRKRVVHALFRDMPLPLTCRQCHSVRMATVAERSSLGYFLSDETLPIDVKDIASLYADRDIRTKHSLTPPQPATG